MQTNNALSRLIILAELSLSLSPSRRPIPSYKPARAAETKTQKLIKIFSQLSIMKWKVEDATQTSTFAFAWTMKSKYFRRYWHSSA